MKRKMVSAETKNKGPENPFSTVIRQQLRVALRNGESLRGIAREAGISHPSLVHFLSGKRTLLLTVADRLAPVLEIVLIEEQKDLTAPRRRRAGEPLARLLPTLDQLNELDKQDKPHSGSNPPKTACLNAPGCVPGGLVGSGADWNKDLTPGPPSPWEVVPLPGSGADGKTSGRGTAGSSGAQ